MASKETQPTLTQAEIFCRKVNCHLAASYPSDFQPVVCKLPLLLRLACLL